MPTKREVEQERDELRATLEDVYERLGDTLGYDDSDDIEEEDDEIADEDEA